MFFRWRGLLKYNFSYRHTCGCNLIRTCQRTTWGWETFN